MIAQGNNVRGYTQMLLDETHSALEKTIAEPTRDNLLFAMINACMLGMSWLEKDSDFVLTDNAKYDVYRAIRALAAWLCYEHQSIEDSANDALRYIQSAMKEMGAKPDGNS